MLCYNGAHKRYLKNKKMTTTTNTTHKKIHLGIFALFGVAMLAVSPLIANAAPTATSELTQEITSGALSTDIRDASGNIVASPSFAMNAATVSTSQQSVTGTFGSNSQRITVDNPGGADGGWTLALNATTPGTETWTDGSDDYAYNGAESAGRLTVNPAVGSLTAVTGGSTGVTLGTSAFFSGSGAITLLTADGSSANIWNGYVTGIGLTQTIPASQPAGSYTLDMTQTVTAT